jgi:hypothetical protein
VGVTTQLQIEVTICIVRQHTRIPDEALARREVKYLFEVLSVQTGKDRHMAITF